MTFEEVMLQLEAMGTEQTKKTFFRHGVREPVFGVKVGDLKKLVKEVKKNQDLALTLYDSGNHDAMYLAGLTVNPKTMTKERLQEWVEKAYWYMLSEYTVAGVTAESAYARELALKWIGASEEMIAACGWSVYANFISITPDEQLDLQEIRGLLNKVEQSIHSERNRVRYTMNGFVIAVGSYVEALAKEAVETAEQIGAVRVDVGNTACKVPLATDYIHKVEALGKQGNKKKTCIC
ncbi:DNA alkylation repair protein [Paenibacillus sp. LMG 31456]|uniref:DNA alkylation repair protein n=1 Tax=Paenibacillus foliorum TaxID=2654974 RepID=A0A972GTA3_9BACL|nr:DNA alkylation repair protein [Paenibacillus foliorum]NOU96342.1 DNA alkylation repair protein [Paenibacillus foliorum]